MKQHKRGKTPVEDAILSIVSAVAAPGRIRRLPLIHSTGHVLAEDVSAVLPQPPFDRSPLDGYALRASDIKGASKEHPIVLPVSSYIPAGSGIPEPLPEGTAARIMTGAAVPRGADCIIRQEDTDEGEERAVFYASLPAGRNICFCGEDIKEGECLVPKGTRLTFAHIGVLAGQGIREVQVYANPKIAVMATGDELIPPEAEPAPGKIYDSNSIMMYSRLLELGVEADVWPAGPDDPEKLAALVDRLLEQYSLVITTGGVSVGRKDYMPEVVDRLGLQLLFHGIAAKPGSPVLAAVRDSSVLLALSGNPFASIATFELLGLPAIAKLSGESQWKQVRTRARLRGNFGKPSNVRRFIRARIEGGYVSIPEKGHSSGSIGTLAGCNCLIDVPEESGALSDGDEVEVWLF